MSPTFEIEQIDENCFRLIKGRLTQHVLKSYTVSKTDKKVYCKRQISFKWLANGDVKFSRPPANTPPHYKPTSDPKIFTPDFPECKHRDLGVKTNKNCGCHHVLWSCKKYDTLIDVDHCKNCVAEGRNGDVPLDIIVDIKPKQPTE